MGGTTLSGNHIFSGQQLRKSGIAEGHSAVMELWNCGTPQIRTELSIGRAERAGGAIDGRAQLSLLQQSP
jgi:hypothetical protein